MFRTLRFLWFIVVSWLLTFCSCCPAESRDAPVSVDVLNANRTIDSLLRPYMIGVRHRIQRLWLTDATPTDFSAKVIFDIGPQGEIYGPNLHTGAGNANFDAEVMHAIELSAPFPPPPQQRLKLLVFFDGRLVTAEDVAAARAKTERAAMQTQTYAEPNKIESPSAQAPTNVGNAQLNLPPIASSEIPRHVENVPANPVRTETNPYSFKGICPGASMAETFRQIASLNYVVRPDDQRGIQYRFTDELSKVTVAGTPVEFGLLTFANGKLSDLRLFVKSDMWASVSLAFREHIGAPNGLSTWSVSTWENEKTTITIFQNIGGYCVVSYSDKGLRRLENSKNASDL